MSQKIFLENGEEAYLIHQFSKYKNNYGNSEEKKTYIIDRIIADTLVTIKDPNGYFLPTLNETTKTEVYTGQIFDKLENTPAFYSKKYAGEEVLKLEEKIIQLKEMIKTLEDQKSKTAEGIASEAPIYPMGHIFYYSYSGELREKYVSQIIIKKDNDRIKWEFYGTEVGHKANYNSHDYMFGLEDGEFSDQRKGYFENKEEAEKRAAVYKKQQQEGIELSKKKRIEEAKKILAEAGDV